MPLKYPPVWVDDRFEAAVDDFLGVFDPLMGGLGLRLNRFAVFLSRDAPDLSPP